MQMTDIEDHAVRFLEALNEHTCGDRSVTVSMYDVGESLGWEREAASRIAEELIGEGWVEVKTLNGGVSITEEGLAQFKGGEDSSGGAVQLGTEPILTTGERTSLDGIVAALKMEAGEKSWDFDLLSEVMADLRTLDAQLSSPRPKTAIVRECLRSLLTVLESSEGRGDAADRVRTLIADNP
jgi:hypothetical protein